MLDLIIILAVILVVGILISIFRVFTLVGIVKGDSKKEIPASNKLQASLLVVFLV